MGSARLGGFKPFQASSIYTNISGSPADSSSATWVAALGGQLIPQYGPYKYVDMGWMGFTWYVVDGATTRHQNVYVDTPDEAYPADSEGTVISLPVPTLPIIQGTMSGLLPGVTSAFTSFAFPPTITDNVVGDKHLFIFDKSNCMSYEMWNCQQYGGNLHCGMAMVFDMLAGDHQRPYFKASGSASGAAFVGMMGKAGELKDGVSAGHALACAASFNLQGIGRKAFTGIAQHHQYGNTNNPDLASTRGDSSVEAILRYEPVFRCRQGHPGDSEDSRVRTYRRRAVGFVLFGDVKRLGVQYVELHDFPSSGELHELRLCSG